MFAQNRVLVLISWNFLENSCPISPPLFLCFMGGGKGGYPHPHREGAQEGGGTTIIVITFPLSEVLYVYLLFIL